MCDSMKPKHVISDYASVFTMFTQEFSNLYDGNKPQQNWPVVQAERKLPRVAQSVNETLVVYQLLGKTGWATVVVNGTR